MKLEPKCDKYVFVEDYRYKDITVPAGFKTDGISYKLRFVALFINRFDPRYIEAAVVHDYLTDLGRWEIANQYFEELLPNTKLKLAMVKAVQLYATVKGYCSHSK